MTDKADPSRRQNLYLTIGSIALIIGPIWGYLSMFICKLMNGGQLLDTITFYLMVIGWMMVPIGILLLLYTLMAGTIMADRRRRAETQHPTRN
jgi:hypothetical protein